MNTHSSYKRKVSQHLQYTLSEPIDIKAAKSIVVRNRKKEPIGIPDHITLKTPHVILQSQCNNYLYPIKTALNTDFSSIYSEPKRICLAVYRVNHCRNRSDILMPFLEYLLYKYPASNKSSSNLFIFPFIKGKNGNILQHANAFFKHLTGYSSKPEGFLEQDQNIYLFYNISELDNYKITRVTLQTQKSELWWCLIDEICNHKKIINFPIHPSVYRLFYTNPPLIYLHTQENKYIDIPIVAFWGNYYKFIPIVAALGQQATSLIPRLGSSYYYGSFRKAVRHAGWTPFYTKQISYNKIITDDDGKYTQGGLIRFALFAGKTKIIHNEHELHNYLQNKNSWFKNYQSLYIGKVWHDFHYYSINPEYITKNHKQQVPLSIHNLDMNSLKANWDPSYTGYKIT